MREYDSSQRTRVFSIAIKIHDHIIRSTEEYNAISNYIANNVWNWNADENNGDGNILEQTSEYRSRLQEQAAACSCKRSTLPFRKPTLPFRKGFSFYKKIIEKDLLPETLYCRGF